MINPKYLPAILTIVQEGSITAASKKLYISQPALSQIIKHVEEELGTQIFNRKARQIELTYAGKLFIESIQKIQQIDHNLHAQIADIKDEAVGHLRLGISAEREQQLLPLVIPEFIRKYPYVHVSLKEGSSAMLERMVLECECDIALVTTSQKRSSLDYTLIEDDKLVLIAAKSTELAHRFPDGSLLDIQEAANESFISMNKGHAVRLIQDQLFEQFALSPRVLLETHNLEAAKGIAARTGSVLLMPRSFVSDASPDRARIHIYPLRHSEFNYKFFICCRKDTHLTRYEQDLISIVNRRMQAFRME